MFGKMMRLASGFADYTVGTAMVLGQLMLAERGQRRSRLKALLSPGAQPGPTQPSAARQGQGQGPLQV
ncbi:MAG: hypothetical protein IT370_24925 [Deltaproteobacteria bacterium]|nr:hypothetical protein [Deltaproteobacteria bacterium]